MNEDGIIFSFLPNEGSGNCQTL